MTIANQSLEIRYLAWSTTTTICRQHIRTLRGNGALAVILRQQRELWFRSLTESQGAAVAGQNWGGAELLEQCLPFGGDALEGF